jgi:outer membrane protein assembly factor BamB
MILPAHFVRFTHSPAAQLGKALTSGTQLVGRTYHPDTIGMDALILVADFAEVRTFHMLAILGVAPPVGAAVSRIAFHSHACPPLANPVDAHLSVPEAAGLAAVGRIAISPGATFASRAVYPYTGAFDALAIDADLAVTRAVLGIAIDRIAVARGAALSLGALDPHAAGLQAFVVHAHFSQAGAGPGGTVLGVAYPPGAGHALAAVDSHANDLGADTLEADVTIKAILIRAIEGQAGLVYHLSIGAAVSYVTGRTGWKDQDKGAKIQKRLHCEHTSSPSPSHLIPPSRVAKEAISSIISRPVKKSLFALTFTTPLWYWSKQEKQPHLRGGIMKRVPGLARSLHMSMLALCLLLSTACTPSIEKLWEFPVSSPIYSTPLVTAEYVIFGSESGTLPAVDKNGQARWRFQAPSAEIFARPVTDDNLIFFGATNQKFYALDKRGQLKWQFAARERIKSDPTVLEGVVYLTSYDGHVYALSTDRGKKLWQFPPPAEPPAEPKEGEEPVEAKPVMDPMPQAFSYPAPVIKDGVLYVGNLDGYMYALQTSDGAMKWRFKAQEGITSTAWVEGGVVYFGSKDDHVYALDAANGKDVKWKFKTKDDVLSSPKIIDGVVYIGSNDKNFYALDAKTGKEKCRFTTKGPVISFGVFYKNLVFFGSGQGDSHFYAIDRGTCEQFFAMKTGYKIESDPVVEGDHIYLTSGDKKLYALKVNKTE